MVRNSTGKFRSTYSSEGSESPNAGSGGSNAKLTRSASSQESISDDRKHLEAALENFKQSPNSNSPPNFHANQTDEGERGESWTLFGKNSKLEGGGQGKLQQHHAHAAAGQNFLLQQKQSQFSPHQNVGGGNSSGSSQSNNDLSGKELAPISPKGNKNIQQQSVPQPKEAIINRRGHSVDDLILHAIRSSGTDIDGASSALNIISENQLVAQTQRKDLMLSKSMYIGQDGSASTTAVEEFPAPDSESGDLNELISNGGGAKGMDTSFDTSLLLTI